MSLPSTFIIAEKHSQAVAYAKTFNGTKVDTYFIIRPCSTFPKGAIIVHGIGYLLTLEEPHLYEGFEHLAKWNLADTPLKIPLPYKYVPSKDKSIAQHLAKIKSLFRKLMDIHGPSNLIGITGTDIDNEGSNIAATILEYCFSPSELEQMTLKRLFINSLEETAVFKGFNNLHGIEKDRLMTQAARARGGADFQLGLSGTRIASILTKHKIDEMISKRADCNLSSKDILGVSNKGRELSMGVGRIISTVVMMIYNREMEYQAFQEQEFYEITADIGSRNGTFKGKVPGFKSFDITETEQLLSSHQLSNKGQVSGKIYKVEKELKESDAPQLHSLTTMQMTASKKWKYGAKTTLTICQGLYEKKLITYPRSSCKLITTAEFSYLAEQLDNYKAAFGVSFPNTYMKPRKRWVNNLKVEEHHALVLTRTVPTKEQLNSLSEAEMRIYLEVMRTTLGMFAPSYQYEQTSILTDINGLLFKSVGNVPVSQGFKVLWGKELETADKEKEEIQMLPPVGEGDPINALIQLKVGHTTPPSFYTEGTLIAAMETAGKLVEESDDIMDIEGIGTPATRADSIESLKSHFYIVVEKQKIRPTVKCMLFCKIMHSSGMFTPTTTAKWDTFLKKLVDGETTKDYIYFIERSGAMVEKFKTVYSTRINEPDVEELINQILDQLEQANASFMCPKCKNGIIRGITVNQNSFYGCSNYSNETAKCNFSIPAIFNKHKITNKQLIDLLNKGKTTAIQFTSAQGKKYKAKLVFKDTTNYKLDLEFVESKKK